jgi:hypothetical protein
MHRARIGGWVGGKRDGKHEQRQAKAAFLHGQLPGPNSSGDAAGSVCTCRRRPGRHEEVERCMIGFQALSFGWLMLRGGSLPFYAEFPRGLRDEVVARAR